MATTSNTLDNIPNFQSDTLNNNTLPHLRQSSPRQPVRRRVRRRANSASNDPAEQLTEMSVRGLNLFRYASVNEGIYQCTECAKENIQKTFKNKYSFQRHAFLYHEGKQRKVFPCPVCFKEFSRPDKMKNHMKTTHECYMPKDCVLPSGYLQMGNESPILAGLKIEGSPILQMGLKMDESRIETSPILQMVEGGLESSSILQMGLKMEEGGIESSSILQMGLKVEEGGIESSPNQS